MSVAEVAGEPWDVLAREGQALKEWASICLALAQGKQAVLLRKGGIHERGFDVKRPCFYMFPTQFHQGPGKMREGCEALGEEAAAAAPPEGKLVIGLACEVVDHVTTTDREALAALAAQTVMTDEALALRYDFKPDQAIHVLVVRAHPLEVPVTLDMKPAFGGCRSWVEVGALPEARPGAPALGDAALKVIRDEVHQILGGGA